MLCASSFDWLKRVTQTTGTRSKVGSHMHNSILPCLTLLGGESDKLVELAWTVSYKTSHKKWKESQKGKIALNLKSA